MDARKTLRVIQAIALVVLVAAVSTVISLDALLPRNAEGARTHAITNKKGPAAFATEAEYKVYQLAYYAGIGAIAAAFVGVGIELKLRLRNPG